LAKVDEVRVTISWLVESIEKVVLGRVTPIRTGAINASDASHSSSIAKGMSAWQ